MSTTQVDTLITRYVLDDQYSAPASKVAATTTTLGTGIPPVIAGFKAMDVSAKGAAGGVSLLNTAIETGPLIALAVLLVSVKAVTSAFTLVSGTAVPAFEEVGKAAEEAKKSISSVVSEGLKPMTDEIAKTLDFVAAGGGFDRMGNRIVEAFGFGKDAAKEFAIVAVAGFETIIEVVTNTIAMLRHLAEGLKFISPAFGAMAKWFIDNFPASIPASFDRNLQNTRADVMFGEAQREQERRAQMAHDQEWAPSLEAGAQNAAVAAGRNKGNFLSVGGQPEDIVSTIATSNRHLQSIDANTRRMSEMQQQILGGGVQGGKGISAVELSQGRTRGGGSGGNPWNDVADAIRRAVGVDMDGHGMQVRRAMSAL